MASDLNGKVAIVTGAAGDIGHAYARGLARAGAEVVLADVNPEGLEVSVDKLAADGYRVVAQPVDITDAASVGAMVERAVEQFGGVDILVNNAALMAQIPKVRLHEFPLDWWDRIMQVNVKGALICAQAAAPRMRERGGGSIVNQSSAGAFALSGAYSVSKLAVVGLTCVLAKDLGPWGIRVNAIAPGIVNTSAGREAATDDLRRRIGEIAPLEPIGEPEDLVGALLYLASSDSKWVTGQTLSVDGGWIMRA
jgi:NAD(P)-dependent dehydrogenase (short-subunit alcohol dehydrogenase family)